jgi:hypothetical protein
VVGPGDLGLGLECKVFACELAFFACANNCSFDRGLPGGLLCSGLAMRGVSVVAGGSAFTVLSLPASLTAEDLTGVRSAAALSSASACKAAATALRAISEYPDTELSVIVVEGGRSEKTERADGRRSG